jgi:hypothetical protein
MIDLTGLAPSEFEELTYDLLRELGAKELSWRKGTPLRGTTSDSGRDIECQFHYPGPTGEVLVERRFVQCKHYKDAVPAERLQSGLSWARAARPDTLLFAVSGFLSNSAKDFIKQYRSTEHPPFRIQTWENPDFEQKLASYPSLLRKYRISAPEPELQILHPAHVRFLTSMRILSLSRLFELLDSLEPDHRDSLVTGAVLMIIQPTVRKPRTGRESFAELVNEDISYSALQGKARELPVDPMFTATGLMTVMLTSAFSAGNYLRAPVIKGHLRDFCDYVRQRADAGGISRTYADQLIARNERMIAETESRLLRGYDDYLRFCSRVLQPLLEYRPEVVLPDWTIEFVERELRGEA